ncbi:hypothetical protein K493DRAFT_249024 [Basidiobolus meristosporus CBS 931.73]|uniref:Uncharacterized protein n=1 Tax=Basidiobolus meristosporus CBS 931.73 TaxID=1314790 RepID=A0A1Y1VTV0_9FUNG|nr:hypothetical protein K493DRAFT_249024 [Basidiobolus meristosporus CBS 931.73]|eukprot:ORX64721.1 hypothetical protein K493DRAFT_249024 [Basidiobolus meristosporus CBS 931.73]
MAGGSNQSSLRYGLAKGLLSVAIIFTINYKSYQLGKDKAPDQTDSHTGGCDSLSNLQTNWMKILHVNMWDHITSMNSFNMGFSAANYYIKVYWQEAFQ